MTALEIDTEASRRAASAWASWADQINAAQVLIGRDIEPLGLTRAAMVCSRIAGAATGLWTVSGFLTLLVEQLEALDGGAPLLRDSALDELMWVAGGRRGSVAACPAENYSGVVGEPGDTYSAELRSPYDLDDADPSELGRRLVTRALQDTADAGQIRKDEFEIVRLNDGRYLVALPGVIDLTNFGFGHDPDNRSVRDLDQSALRSSIDTSIGGNAYARMVSEALVARGVPLGSQLVIVGHSFGADTALDLASDPAFNGPAGFDVTHVVAAAYDSSPQLDNIPGPTRVLALQNRDDVPVLAETVEHAFTQPVEDAHEIIDGATNLDADKVLGGFFGAVRHPLMNASAPLRHVASHADDVVGDLRRGQLGDAAQDAVLPIPSTDARTESQVEVMFDGGFGDYGHHQDRYIEFVDSTTDPLVLGFFGSLATGTAVSGTAVAVDVSVPEKQRTTRRKLES